MPDNWTAITGNTAVSLALSKVTDVGGFYGDFLRLTISIAGGGTGSSYIRLYDASLTAGISPGDYITGGCLINVSAASGGTDMLKEVFVKVWDAAAGNHSIVGDNDSTALGSFAWSGMYRTDPVLAGSAPNFRWELYAYLDLTGAADSVTIDIAKYNLR